MSGQPLKHKTLNGFMVRLRHFEEAAVDRAAKSRLSESRQLEVEDEYERQKKTVKDYVKRLVRNQKENS